MVSTPPPQLEHERRLRLERVRQVRGLMLLALAIITFSILRFGVHRVFTPGWWRLW